MVRKLLEARRALKHKLCPAHSQSCSARTLCPAESERNAMMKSLIPYSPMRTALALCGVLLLSACGTVSMTSSSPDAGSRGGVAAPSLGFFSKIKAPADHEPVLRLAARGVQVFRCEKRESQGTWVFRQPDAELLDAAGKVVGRHGANFS